MPALTVTSTACDDITAWSAGTASSASVADGTGTLVLVDSTIPSLSYTARSVGSASGWSAGTLPALTITSVACDDITAWDAGTQASLSYTARSIPNISVSSKTVVTAS